MLARTSLCNRLTFALVLALALGLACFSVVSLLAIDRTLRTALDSRLAASERLFVETATGKTIDTTVARRLLAILSVQQDGAIVRADGTVAVESAALPEAVLRAGLDVRSGSQFALTVVNGTPVRVIATRLALANGRDAVALVWRPLDVLDDYERSAAFIFSVLSFVILLLTGAIGRRLIRRALRPLAAMAAGASEIEAHDLSRRLSNGAWAAELRHFAATFDRMLERLEEAFRRQRQFTADASHDLRAPLAVMRAEVDIARARRRSAVADDESFASLADEIGDLDRLIEALLAVARADGDIVVLTPLHIADAVGRATQRIGVFASAHDVRVECDAAQATVLAETETFDRMLMALLHNAVKFSPPGGTVRITTDGRDDSVEMTIRDEGPGFSADALQFAFDRFWRDDSARGRSGSGLGLAIAKASVERFGGSIAIQNAPAGGGLVTVRLAGSTA